MLVDLLNNVAAENCDSIAIEFGKHKINYTKLNNIINKLANGLLNIGIQKGDRVAILLPNVPHFIFAYYAILKIGGIIVPINPLLTENEINTIIQKTQPSAVIIFNKFYNELTSLVQDFKHTIILGETSDQQAISLTKLIAASTNDAPKIDVNAEESALIQYTPGISNLPKGIELTHQNLTSIALSCINTFATNKSDIYGGILPLFLLYSQNVIVNPALIRGAKLILYPKFDIESLNQAIFKDDITFIAGSPNLFQNLLEQKSSTNDSHHLKYVVSFDSPCNKKLLLDFEKSFNIPILEGYGTLEASALISCNRVGINRKNGSVGLPIDGVSVKIIDDDSFALAPNEIGEIVVKGKNVMKGYWEYDEKSNSIIKDGWLYTGDLGKIDDEGFLYFTERKDNLILKGGFHIYPREIEKIIKKHPKVDQVSVVDIAHPTHKQEVKACIVLKENQQATSEEIIEFCKDHIPVYKCPQIVQFYSSFPKSATGKIIKRRLRELKE